MTRTCILLTAALILSACNSSSGGDAASQDVTVVFGTLTAADGAGISGARVVGGGASTTTGSDGTFELKAAVAPRITVRFEAEGYLPAFRSSAVLDKKPTALHATLVAEAPAQLLDAAMGGMIEGERGSAVMVPAGALVGAEGLSVEGMVDVHLTPLDPSNPVELEGATDTFAGQAEDGTTGLIESFGMVDVTIRQDGAKLQVADGQMLEIHVPPPAGVTDPPATIALWSLDEEANLWKQEGEATWDADAGVYVGQIGHMSPWNCDRPLEATCITGLVKDTDDAVLPGARITARGADYNGTSSAVALDDGRFWVAVRKDSDVSVLASHAAGGGTSRVVRSGTEDTAIPPTPDDPRCLDVGEWIVERGVVTTSDGRTVACGAVDQNPFAGTCASELGDLFQCYQPRGDCTSSGGVGNSVLEWDNGVRVELMSADGRFDVVYRGANGQTCATATLEFDEETGETGDFDLSFPTGQMFSILNIDDDTQFGVRCPSGEEVFWERSDLEALEACGFGPDDDSSNTCQPAGGGGAGGGGGTPGQPTLCMQDSECPAANETCCVIDQQGGQGACFDRQLCQQIMDAQNM